VSTLFRLDASIRQDGSVSRAVADTIESTLLGELGDTTVVRRDVAADPLDPHVWGTAAFAGFTPEDQRSAAQRSALAAAASYADEVAGADALVFAVPLYNFGVSQHFKTWYDVVSTDRRFAPGTRTLAGRPGFLVTTRGGGYGEGTPRAGWDHATGWMRRVLEDVWGLDLEVVETELTLAEITPAMADLRELARQQLADSHDAARHAARSVTVRLRSVA
jgi:FMN-dependent NADH-azoreductase